MNIFYYNSFIYDLDVEWIFLIYVIEIYEFVNIYILRLLYKYFIKSIESYVLVYVINSWYF